MRGKLSGLTQSTTPVRSPRPHSRSWLSKMPMVSKLSRSSSPPSVCIAGGGGDYTREMKLIKYEKSEV